MHESMKVVIEEAKIAYGNHLVCPDCGAKTEEECTGNLSFHIHRGLIEPAWKYFLKELIDKG